VSAGIVGMLNQTITPMIMEKVIVIRAVILERYVRGLR